MYVQGCAGHLEVGVRVEIRLGRVRLRFFLFSEVLAEEDGFSRFQRLQVGFTRPPLARVAYLVYCDDDAGYDCHELSDVCEEAREGDFFTLVGLSMYGRDFFCMGVRLLSDGF